METPNILKGIAACRKQGLAFDIMSTSFFMSRRSLKASPHSGMPVWQDKLFIALAELGGFGDRLFPHPGRARGGDRRAGHDLDARRDIAAVAENAAARHWTGSRFSPYQKAIPTAKAGRDARDHVPGDPDRRRARHGGGVHELVRLPLRRPDPPDLPRRRPARRRGRARASSSTIRRRPISSAAWRSPSSSSIPASARSSRPSARPRCRRSCSPRSAWC